MKAYYYIVRCFIVEFVEFHNNVEFVEFCKAHSTKRCQFMIIHPRKNLKIIYKLFLKFTDISVNFSKRENINC